MTDEKEIPSPLSDEMEKWFYEEKTPEERKAEAEAVCEIERKTQIIILRAIIDIIKRVTHGHHELAFRSLAKLVILYGQEELLRQCIAHIFPHLKDYDATFLNDNIRMFQEWLVLKDQISIINELFDKNEQYAKVNK